MIGSIVPSGCGCTWFAVLAAQPTTHIRALSWLVHKVELFTSLFRLQRNFFLRSVNCTMATTETPVEDAQTENQLEAGT